MPDKAGWTADTALRALTETLDEGVLVFDESGVCRVAGRRAAELFGLDPAALLGLGRRDVMARLGAGLRAPEVLGPLGDDALSIESTVVDPVDIERPHARTVVWTSVPIAMGATRVGRLDVLRDVTRERRAEEAAEEAVKRLELASTLDDLTGLVNRRRFEEECQREHRRAQREWISYAVARVDVDKMGRINEALGRPVGDDLLRRLGEELRSARREYDVVARWIDDEFILLLPRADAHAARKVIKRAVAGVHEKGRQIAPDMSVCVGVAIWAPPSGEGAADIVQRAGDALARARARGPATIEIDAGLGGFKDDTTEG
jgi:diguanylate cyclase (GGDEF)-like protein